MRNCASEVRVCDAPRNDSGNYCPFSVSTLSQALLSRARCCLRQLRTASSPSFITARQWRETSRAQASCPASRPCWADAAEASKTNEVTKRILIIWLRLTSATRVIRFRCAVDVNPPQARKSAWTGWRLDCVAYCGLLGRDLARLLGQIPVHHGSATRAQVGPMLHHARGDFRNIGDFRTAQAKRIAGAHLLRLAVDDNAASETARASTGPA